MISNLVPKVLASAKEMETRFARVPVLDGRAKRKEVNYLFNELVRDAKTAYINERSNRDEIFSCIVGSMVEWLNDIWSVAVEHNVNYAQAHTCLLMTADILNELGATPVLSR